MCSKDTKTKTETKTPIELNMESIIEKTKKFFGITEVKNNSSTVAN